MREPTSFNGHVHKDLLAIQYDEDSCCARTELLTLLATMTPAKRNGRIEVHTNDVLFAQRLLQLCRHVLGRQHPVQLHQRPSASTPGRHRMELSITQFDDFTNSEAALAVVKAEARKRHCCAGAFLRGLYWKGGYISSPKKGFHLEICLPRHWPKKSADSAIKKLGLTLRHTKRRERAVLYAKSSEHILVILNEIGATTTVLLLQDILITKELKNEVNRGVNCEVGNLRRSSVSSAADIEAVRFLEKSELLQHMPEKLRVVAEARCRFPSLTLKELGQRLEPPLSKAGVFHRLRQLRKEAEYERKRQG